MNWKNFVTMGKDDEIFVAKQILSQLGGVIIPASLEEDTKDHVDFWWIKLDGERVGVDVKGMRRKSRYDLRPNNDITWLEFKNVLGEPGWLYGKAKYFAFRRIGLTVFVDREKLVSYAENLVRGKQVVSVRPTLCGIPYTRARWGRNDITMMVSLDDIQSLADFVLFNS